jgi:hypothetical protein
VLGGFASSEVYGELASWLQRSCEQAGVIFEVGVDVDAQRLSAGAFDAVVLATGLRSVATEAETQARTVADVLRPASIIGARLLIFGSSQRAMLIARELAVRTGQSGQKKPAAIMLLDFSVSAATLPATPRATSPAVPSPDFARGFSKLERAYATVVDLPALGVTARFCSRLLQVLPGRVDFLNEYGEREALHFDTLVDAREAGPDTSLADALRASTIPIHLVGDARGARTVAEAIHEGAIAGREI